MTDSKLKPRGSQRLPRFVVSTDDLEIESVAKSLGAEVNRRPKHLAQDDTPAPPVVAQLLQELDPNHCLFDSVIYLQPTTPLRTAADIDAALELFEQTNADSVVSVYRVDDHHPARMYRLESGRLIPYDHEPVGRLRQQLPAVYHRNGAIYVCKRSIVDGQQTLIGPDVRPYVMPRDRSVNIDDELDLVIADILLQREMPRLEAA
jgi:CMP-N,N'-diacetyllegionaminic acid synthase